MRPLNSTAASEVRSDRRSLLRSQISCRRDDLVELMREAVETPEKIVDIQQAAA